MPTIRVEIQGRRDELWRVAEFPFNVRVVARKWGRDIAGEYRDAIRSNIHSRTGVTARSVMVVEAPGDLISFDIRAGHVVQWLEEGTGLYGPRHQVIRPLHAKALAFQIGGQTIIRRSVRGMQPQGVISRAQTGMSGRLPARIAELGASLKAAY